MNQTHLHTLKNGVRLLAIPMSQRHSATVGVFVRTGSRNESEENNGVSHFLEHMAFKGTRTRNVQSINLDAEMLGIDLNAYTSQDTTGYFMSGLNTHASRMLDMLADIVCHSTLPEDELERERQVILQEAVEYEEDPQSIAMSLLDRASYGDQSLGMPIIGPSDGIETLSRDQIESYMRKQYTGHNMIVACSGNVDVDAFFRQAEALFGDVPAGERNHFEAPSFMGGTLGFKVQQVSQVFVGIGFKSPSIQSEGHDIATVAATLFGGGMSSPLVDQVRERMGLAYQVGCENHASDLYGRFMIDAIITPNNIADFMKACAGLLRRHMQEIDPVHLERAKNQLKVSIIRSAERGLTLLEHTVENLFSRQHCPSIEAHLQRIESITADDVRGFFQTLAGSQPAISMVGKVGAKPKFDFCLS